MAAQASNFRTFRAALFDLDGTLLDSLGLWDEVDRIFFMRRGMSVPPGFAKLCSEHSFRELAVYCIRNYGFRDEVEAILAEWDQLCEHQYHHEVELIPGAKAYLQALQAAKIPLAVVTASRPQLFEACLARHGIASCFQFTLSSLDLPFAKRDPRFYLQAAERLALPPTEIAVFEDVALYCERVESVGFSACLIEGPPERRSSDFCPRTRIRDFNDLLELPAGLLPDRF